jgi:hypothetical protein
MCGAAVLQQNTLRTSAAQRNFSVAEKKNCVAARDPRMNSPMDEPEEQNSDRSSGFALDGIHFLLGGLIHSTDTQWNVPKGRTFLPVSREQFEKKKISKDGKQFTKYYQGFVYHKSINQSIEQ